MLVLHDHEARAGAYAYARLRAEARERVARVLLPVAVGLEHDGHAWRLGGEARDDVLDEPGAALARQLAKVVARKAGLGGVPAEQDRRQQLDPRPCALRARCGARAEQRARREVLDLALAVDRGVRHDGDRLVEVVGEVRTRRERGERAVVAERADQLVAGLRHERGLLEIVRLEAERRELLLAAKRDVLELVGRNADLPPSLRLDASAGALDGLRRQRGPAAGEALAQAVHDHAAIAPHPDEPRTHRGLVEEAPAAVAALERDAIARSERHGVGDVALERDKAPFAREHVRVRGLDVPERPQAERVDAENARVADARQDTRRTLRERSERGRRREEWVREVGEIGHELVTRAPELVHRGVSREGDHGRFGLALDVDGAIVEIARADAPTAP